jgi:hypothetical protein
MEVTEEPEMVAKEVSKSEVPAEVAKFVAPDCPTEFGDYANDVPCFTKCKAKVQCKAEFTKKQLTGKKAAAATNDDDTL